MDKLTHYRQILRDLVTQYGSYKPSYGEIETEVLIDQTENHFQLLRVGWLNGSRVHGMTLHFDLIDSKIWIQRNGTDREITDELMEAGVPKEDIVLAFHPENVRQYTGFAVS